MQRYGDEILAYWGGGGYRSVNDIFPVRWRSTRIQHIIFRPYLHINTYLYINFAYLQGGPERRSAVFHKLIRSWCSLVAKTCGRSPLVDNRRFYWLVVYGSQGSSYFAPIFVIFFREYVMDSKWNTGQVFSSNHFFLRSLNRQIAHDKSYLIDNSNFFIALPQL